MIWVGPTVIVILSAFVVAVRLEWLSWMKPKKKYVRYEDPWSNGPVDVLVEDAIAQQKKTAKELNPTFVYKSDDDALGDYMAVHWAQIIEK